MKKIICCPLSPSGNISPKNISCRWVLKAPLPTGMIGFKTMATFKKGGGGMIA